jgi:hypothetical protein
MTPEEYRANRDYNPEYEEGQEPEASMSDDAGEQSFEDFFNSLPLTDVNANNEAAASAMTEESAGSTAPSYTSNPYAPEPSTYPGTSTFGTSYTGPVGIGQQSQAQTSQEQVKQKIKESMVNAGSAGIEALKKPEIFTNKVFLHNLAKFGMVSGSIYFILFLISLLINLFTEGALKGISTLFLTGVFTFLVGFSMDTFIPKPAPTPVNQEPITPSNEEYYDGIGSQEVDDDFLSALPSDLLDDAASDEDEEAPEETTDDSTEEPSDDDDSEDSLDWGNVVDPSEVALPPEIPSGTWTRQYLFEAMSKVLPNINPSFNEEVEYAEDSEEFEFYGLLVSNSAELLGLDTEVVKLVKCVETEPMIRLQISRQSGASSKESKLQTEILNSYKINPETGDNDHPAATAFSNYNGGIMYLNIVKGISSMVSVADVLEGSKDFILDPKVERPWVFGIGQQGQVYKTDIFDINSMIFAGKARSGKSWSIEEFLFFLCWFTSPKETNIHILDAKAGASSYLGFQLPHVKKFLYNASEILDDLNWATSVEAKRRQDIFEEHGVSKIQDLYEIDNNMREEVPYLYLIVEEMIGLQSKMDDDQKSEWRSQQQALVTQLPAYGIFAIFVPHRITNDVISKTTSANISVQFGVRMDSDDIKSSFDVKDFPYSLDNRGDSIAKVEGVEESKPFFSHALVISDSNATNKKIYKYLSDIWHKLCPDSPGYFDTVGAMGTGTEQVSNTVIEETPSIPDSDDNIPDTYDIKVPVSPVKTKKPVMKLNITQSEPSPSVNNSPKKYHWKPVDKSDNSEILSEDFWNQIIDTDD